MTCTLRDGAATMTVSGARDFLALDLETTGLSSEFDRIVEIGAVRFEASGRELGRFEQLVNPERPIPRNVQAIHGITDAHVADAPCLAQVLPSFVMFLGDPESTTLLAHNASFDAGFLGTAMRRLNLPPLSHRIVDTLALSRWLQPGQRNYRLDTLARRFGLDPDGPHRALADSLRVKGLWLALQGPIQPPERLTAYPILDTSRGTAVPAGWESIHEAITNGWRVRMNYAGGTQGPAPREVTPRAIVVRGGTAYLVALCHIGNIEKSFRLDRVHAYEVLPAPKHPPESLG